MNFKLDIRNEVFKFQVPIASNFEKPPALIYNEDRSITAEFQVCEDLLHAMKGRKKAFFECDIVNDLLQINREVDDPGW